MGGIFRPVSDPRKAPAVLSKIMTREDNQSAARAECEKVCLTLRVSSPVPQSHRGEGFQLYPLLVPSAKGLEFPSRAAWSNTDCIRPTRQPSPAQHLAGQALWWQETFRDCQGAEAICDESPRPLVRTRGAQGSPARSSKLSSVCCSWSCVKDSPSLGSCVT